MLLHLGCIVEGHGDVAAVPVLLRRLQKELKPELHLDIPPPWRTGRYKLVKPRELERSVERLARQLREPRAILILVDADDDCPKELAPQLLSRARSARSDIPIGLVLAKYEFEAWFLAAVESLQGHCGLEEDISPPPDPEAVHDVKGFLGRHMKGSRSYSQRIDQPALTAVFDMELARKRSNSFEKCYREVQRLLAEACG